MVCSHGTWAPWLFQQQKHFFEDNILKYDNNKISRLRPEFHYRLVVEENVCFLVAPMMKCSSGTFLASQKNLHFQTQPSVWPLRCQLTQVVSKIFFNSTPKSRSHHMNMGSKWCQQETRIIMSICRGAWWSMLLAVGSSSFFLSSEGVNSSTPKGRVCKAGHLDSLEMSVGNRSTMMQLVPDLSSTLWASSGLQ